MTSTMVSGSKEADLAGPGIGDYAELEKVLPEDYHSILGSARDAGGHLHRQGRDRGGALPRTRPDPGPGPAHRRRRVRRQRHARPRRLADADPVPHLERPRPPSHRRPGRPGRDQVEEAALKRVRDGARRGPRHGHARGPQGLLPGPRPQRLRRPVGLGEGHHPGRARPRLSQAHRPGDLAGPARRRGARPVRLPAAPHRPLPGSARGDHLPPRRGDPRALSDPAAQAARDADPRATSRRSSSSASAGRWRTATRTRCAPPTTTTG